MTRTPLASLLAAAWVASVMTAAATQDAHTEDVEVIKTPAVPDDNPTPDLAAVSQSIVERTNAFRKERGLGPAAVDDKLTAAAEAFAAYMAREDRYGHTADGDRPAGRAKAHGYTYCIVLENIAYAFDPAGFTAEKLADQFVTGWKESPGHRKNMLDPDVTETGVAVGRSKKTGYYYAVQMFGRPKSAAIEFEVENRADEAFDYVLGGRNYSLPPKYTRTHTVCRPSRTDSSLWTAESGASAGSSTCPRSLPFIPGPSRTSAGIQSRSRSVLGGDIRISAMCAKATRM